MENGVMPQQATCCRCKREFPVKAVMSLKSGNIPMLVVLSEVTSVEDAIANATCQVCLGKEGPKDRGLHAVLTSLGCRESQTRPGSVVLLPRSVKAELHVDLGALAKGNKAQRGPSMAGVRVVLPEMPRRGNFRPVRPREERIDDKPRLPKVLVPEQRRESEPKVEPLRVRLDEADQAQLRALRQKIREQNTARFQVLVPELRTELDRIRVAAAKEDVGGAVDAFVVKLGEAVRVDPGERGKAKLMLDLQVSESELENLRLSFWVTHTIIPKKGGDEGGGEGGGRDSYEVCSRGSRRPAPGVRLEQVEENPFPNGRRPRHFDRNGNEGRQVALKPVNVMREKVDPHKTSLPSVPNERLGEPEGLCPKIVYPEGGRYGKDYTVQGSRRVAYKGNAWAWAQMQLLLFADEHPESVVSYTNDPVDGIAQRVEIPLLELMCAYMEPFVLDEIQRSSLEAATLQGEPAPSAEVEPHTEV